MFFHSNIFFKKMSLSVAEKKASKSSLVCLFHGLEGCNIIIDLRDETSIKGNIVKVDGFMNIELKNVLYTAPTGMKVDFKSFFCQGKYIRYVHIPKEVNVLDIIKESLEHISMPGRRGNFRSRRPGGRRGGYGRSRGGYGGRGYRGGGSSSDHRVGGSSSRRYSSVDSYKGYSSRY